MLHVILKPPFDELDLPNQCAHFEIGQSTQGINIDLVESVWADGKELHYVYDRFNGIPKVYQCLSDNPDDPDSPTTIKWFGDDAKFIVANWT